MDMPRSSAATDARPQVELGSTIDQLDVGRYQIWIMVLCGATVFLDGFDTQAMGYVAPSLSAAWKLERGALGPVFSAGLFGIMIGALAGGPIADAIGRRKVILAACLWFGLLSLVTALATDLTQLMVLRGLTGLGLGAAMPNAIALVSEFSPGRRRASMVMIMFCGFSLGAALGGVAAGLLLQRFGWTSVFIVGGIAPLLFAPLLVAALPESVRFLAAKNNRHEAIPPILSRLGKAPPPDAEFVIAEEKAQGFSVVQLFSERRGAATLLLWLIFFMSLLDLYLLASWLPTVINGMGLSVTTAVFVSSLFQVGGTAAPPVLGLTIDRLGFFGVLVGVFLASACAISALGLIGSDVGPLAVAVFIAGFCVVGGQGTANGLAASLYPTVVRGTGVGWALGIGRIGSILGPAIGAVMLAQKLDRSSIFFASAVPALIAASAGLCLWLLRPKLTTEH
jgi:MFS transporter, AAHS family, 4-hydroxybenzoate transporter